MLFGAKACGDLDPDSAEPSVPLLLPGGARFWTEHGERNWLPSLGAVLGFSREDMNRVGRWASDTSETYAWTTRAIVDSSQRAVACSLADPGQRHSFLKSPSRPLSRHVEVKDLIGGGGAGKPCAEN